MIGYLRPVALFALITALLMPGCLGDHEPGPCSDGDQDLQAKAQPKDTTFDRDRQEWVGEGPTILGRYKCVDEHRVSEVAFGVFIPAIGTFVYHIDESDEDDNSQPRPLHVQAVDSAGRHYEAGRTHPANELSVGLAMGTWHESWRTQTGPERNFPYLNADFIVSFEGMDADVLVERFPQGSVYLDIWERDAPDYMIRTQIKINADGSYFWGPTTHQFGMPTIKDPLTGNMVPQEDAVR